MIDISIVTPTYNRASLLPRVWRSINGQEASFQWIVADDGSTDDTPSVIAGFNDPRIVYVRLPVNRGVNAARNAGAKAADGRYVVFLDSDDELYPKVLPRMLEVMDGADRSIGSCAFVCESVTGERISRVAHNSVLDELQIVCHGALRQELIYIYRREVFEHFQLPDDLRGCEQVFVYQLSQRYRCLAIDEPGRVMHWHGGNMSGIESLIHRSNDIAVSYERILKNHSDVLRGHTATSREFLRKAMYRYGIAGQRRNVWRLYRQLIAQSTHPTHLLSSSVLFIISVTAPRWFERWRMCRLQQHI